MYRQDEITPARFHFTKIDLIASFVLVSIVGVLIWAALMPGYVGNHLAQCKNNLAQLGKVLKLREALGHPKVSPNNWEAEFRPFLEVDEEDFAFQCPAREAGVRIGGEYSFAMNTKTPIFGEKDAGRVIIVDSDHRLIEIDNDNSMETVVGGRPVVRARHNGVVNALLYSGSVRSFEPNEIMPDNAKTLREFWLPESEKVDISEPVTITD